MRIEISVTRVIVRHHEACRVMPNIYPEWQNFQFAPSSHYRFILLHTLPSTIVFKLGYALFYQFYVKWVHFRSSNVRFGICLRRPDVTHEGKYPERVKITENHVGYARNSVLPFLPFLWRAWPATHFKVLWPSTCLYMSRLMTKPIKWLCAQRRLRSAWASA